MSKGTKKLLKRIQKKIMPARCRTTLDWSQSNNIFVSCWGMDMPNDSEAEKTTQEILPIIIFLSHYMFFFISDGNIEQRSKPVRKLQ